MGVGVAVNSFHQSLGSYAWPGLFALIVLLLAFAGGAVWLLLVLARQVRARLGQRVSPNAYLLIYALVGASVFLAALIVFAELAEAMHAENEIGRFDIWLAQVMRSHVPVEVLRVFTRITWLGNVETLVAIGILVAVALAILRERLLLAAWVLATAVNGLLIPVLKAIFHRVRPVHEHGLVIEQGWSFPSGHASGAMVVYGMLAYLALRRWSAPLAWCVAALMLIIILAVGLSRVVLHVHYFSDVLAGYVSGAAWLTVCITACEIASQRALSKKT